MTARREYNIPPLATHADAVTALSLYADEDLNGPATRWLDMSLVKELYPPRAHPEDLPRCTLDEVVAAFPPT